MTDIEETGGGIGEDMDDKPITQRECDMRFEMVKQIGADVRDLSKTMAQTADEIKQMVNAACSKVSALETRQEGLEGSTQSFQRNHVKSHEKGNKNRSTWVAIVIAFLGVAVALVSVILNNT